MLGIVSSIVCSPYHIIDQKEHIMSIEQEAALNLLEQAKQASQYSTMNLLLESAARLDSTIDTVSFIRMWIDQWMIAEKTKRSIL